MPGPFKIVGPGTSAEPSDPLKSPITDQYQRQTGYPFGQRLQFWGQLAEPERSGLLSQRTLRLHDVASSVDPPGIPIIASAARTSAVAQSELSSYGHEPLGAPSSVPEFGQLWCGPPTGARPLRSHARLRSGYGMDRFRASRQLVSRSGTAQHRAARISWRNP